MTNSTSHCSSLRMKATRPAGTLASTYTRGCPAIRAAWAPSSERERPHQRCRSRSGIVSVASVGRRMVALRRARLALQRRDELVALVHQLLARAPAVLATPTTYSQNSGKAIVESQ